MPAAVVACSSATARLPITEDDAGPTPTEPPTSTPPPTTTQPQPPPTGEKDAGTDAPDTCVRTAPSKKCGLVPQCGCTTTETCDVADQAGNVECVTAGKAVMGNPCVATAGCARGLTCMFGTCHAYCNTPGSACTEPNTNGCLQVKGSNDAGIPNLAVCQVKCDLRDAVGCGGTTPAGTGLCIVDDKGTTDCVNVASPKPQGAACAPTDDCAPSTVCVTTGGAPNGTCRKWCRVGTTDCGGAVACPSFGTKVFVGTQEYGACP